MKLTLADTCMYWQWGRVEDHTSVIEYYYREVKKLMKGFHTYFGATNEILRMSVGCLFHSSDRPERHFAELFE